MLLARLMSGYGRDASLNAKERKAPGTASITQLPGSPSASRSSNLGSEAVDGKCCSYHNGQLVPHAAALVRQLVPTVAANQSLC